MKYILDASCGSKMIWFDKANKDTLFVDKRTVEDELCDGRKLSIDPDLIADFTHLPFETGRFSLVVFDPPHLVKVGDKSWLAKKYGKLDLNWENTLSKGFSECMRVLSPHGTLIFKWNEQQIKLNDVLKAIKYKPLFGNRRSKTIWLVFNKSQESENRG